MIGKNVALPSAATPSSNVETVTSRCTKRNYDLKRKRRSELHGGNRDALLGAMKQHLRQLDAAVRATAATVQAIEIANATKAANAAHLSDSVEQLRRSVDTVSEAAAGLRASGTIRLGASPEASGGGLVTVVQ